MCNLCPPHGPPRSGKGQYGYGSSGFSGYPVYPGYPSHPGYRGYPGYAGFPGFHGHPGSGRADMMKLGQLLGVCAVATVGTLSHIYTISACVVGDRLRKKGNEAPPSGGS